MDRSQACPVACLLSSPPWLSTHTVRVPAQQVWDLQGCNPVLELHKTNRQQHRDRVLQPLQLDTMVLYTDAMTPGLKIASGQFDFLQISGQGHKNGDCSGEMG